MNKIEIKDICIKIGKKEIKVSVEEAKELQRILSDLFGGTKIDIIREITYPIYPNYPIITYDKTIPYYNYEIICDNINYEDGCLSIG